MPIIKFKALDVVMKDDIMICLSNSFVLIILLYSEGSQAINVALGKPASQLSDLDYSGFRWTANLAVDGCLDRDDPDTQRCCSATEGTGTSNFWRVDLGQTYSIGLMIVNGRAPPDGEQQLSGFQVFTTGTIGGPETLAYDNGGVQYGDGVFNITFQPERAVASVIIRRPIIMVLCEVEVYDYSVTSTASTTTPNANASSTQAGGSTQGFSGSCFIETNLLLLFLMLFTVMNAFKF